ncbi:MAG: hypothetical protein KGY56_14450 [Desulfobacterales bacterium]|nr:hypothetical protein [Desulfobacterales bacterium]
MKPFSWQISGMHASFWIWPRSSYQLRDDDNIHLGRIEAQVSRALREAARAAASNEIPSGRNLRARQLVGKPAGP